MPLKNTELRTALAHLHYGIMDFLGKWHDELIKGERTAQQKAAWMIWTRWAIANRALHHLHHEEDIPDCFTLARLGLELEAALAAVCADAKIAEAYLAFGDTVRVKSFRKMIEQGETERAESVKGKLPPDHEDTKKYKALHWFSGGASALIKKYGRDGDYGLYAAYCHMAHGSVIGNELMFRSLAKGAEEAAKEYGLDSILWMCLARFVRATQRFLDVAVEVKGGQSHQDLAALERLLGKVTLIRDKALREDGDQ